MGPRGLLDVNGGNTGFFMDEGKSAVVLVQQNSDRIDFEKLLPIEFEGITKGGLASVQQINRFTKNIDFGIIKNIFNIVKKSDGITMVSVNNTDIISLFKMGNGKVVYYGILDNDNDFKLTPGYPIFWNNLLYSLVGREDLNNVNLKTGTLFTQINESKILDKSGLYDFDHTPIAVNLLNEKESNINFVDTSSNAEFVTGNLEKVKSYVDHDLDTYIAALLLLLLVFEIIYIKIRGEI